MSQNEGRHPSVSIITPVVILAFAALTVLAAVEPIRAEQPTAKRSVSKLLDLSGLAWIGGDNFLVVHDAKNPDERGRTRVSLLVLPSSLDGILWRELHPRFPGGLSSDLESAARIPGYNEVLLVESGDNAGPFQRIFLAELDRNRVNILDVVEWDSFTEVFNVEATAVAETDNGLIFIWAERNSGEQFTDINWADLTLDPFMIGGNSGSVEFTLPAGLVNELGNPLYSRPVVGMNVDSAGHVYTVAAFDPEDSVPDPDNGPFRSVVFKIAEVVDGMVVLDGMPTIQATVDGLKVETVAVREDNDHVDLFIGTDDENYGGTLRLLPPLDLP